MVQEQRSEDNFGAALYCHVHKLWWWNETCPPRIWNPWLSVVLPGKVWAGQPCRRNYADCGSRCELSASCACRRASPAMMDPCFHKWLWSQRFITATDTHGFQGSHSALSFVKGFALNSQ